MTLSLPHAVADHAIQDNFDRLALQFPLTVVIPQKAGIPDDADYANPPPIGSFVLDISNNRLYVRVSAGSWLYAALVA